MSESEFKKCPRYPLGPNNCCFARHEAHIKNFLEYCIATLEYKDGKKITIPWLAFLDAELTSEFGRRVWLSYLLESKEIVEIQLTDWQSELTEKSQKLIWDFHPGLETTPLLEDCPFRKS